MQSVININFPMLPNEFWYGGCVSDGTSMPYSANNVFSQSLQVNESSNQAVPFLVSNKGRYIWSDEGFDYTFQQGKIIISYTKEKPQMYEGYGTLKGAFLAAAKEHFTLTGKRPPAPFFESPQYNTWIEFMYEQNQQGILSYAQSVINSGLPVGIIMIDCGWAEYYGCFEFHSGRFPRAKEMVDKLHQKGFKVMLWECPFVSPDSVAFRQLAAKGYLVKNQTGEPAIKHWWDGYSAVLDLTNPKAVEWLHQQNSYLMDTYGIDGFKMDAGDAKYYHADDVTYQPITPNEHCKLWAQFALNYEYNELRACYQCSGQALVQRLADKCHSWDETGLQSLIPNILAQGIAGYAYTCPDMIGGGEYMNFLSNCDHLDGELVVRYAQCSALMPMMQFSAAPWRILSEEDFLLCKNAAWLHARYSEQILRLADLASKTGEPIVRYMEYVFPGEGFETITSQFMLGDDMLVAPVINKSAVTKNVVFPRGNWKSQTGEIIAGPCEREIPVTVSLLPFYIKTGE